VCVTYSPPEGIQSHSPHSLFSMYIHTTIYKGVLLSNLSALRLCFRGGGGGGSAHFFLLPSDSSAARRWQDIPLLLLLVVVMARVGVVSVLSRPADQGRGLPPL
jgi:hypothetical protein